MAWPENIWLRERSLREKEREIGVCASGKMTPVAYLKNDYVNEALVVYRAFGFAYGKTQLSWSQHIFILCLKIKKYIYRIHMER